MTFNDLKLIIFLMGFKSAYVRTLGHYRVARILNK